MGKKVLVIGSGPSGIFTCGALSSDSSIDVKVWVTLIRISNEHPRDPGIRTTLNCLSLNVILERFTKEHLKSVVNGLVCELTWWKTTVIGTLPSTMAFGSTDQKKLGSNFQIINSTKISHLISNSLKWSNILKDTLTT